MEKYLNTEKIEKYLKDNKLTKKEFCKKCNISVSTLNRMYKSDNIRVINIFKVAKGMEVDVCFLFYEEHHHPILIYK